MASCRGGVRKGTGAGRGKPSQNLSNPRHQNQAKLSECHKGAPNINPGVPPKSTQNGVKDFLGGTSSRPGVRGSGPAVFGGVKYLF